MKTKPCVFVTQQQYLGKNIISFTMEYQFQIFYRESCISFSLFRHLVYSFLQPKCISHNLTKFAWKLNKIVV